LDQNEQDCNIVITDNDGIEIRENMLLAKESQRARMSDLEGDIHGWGSSFYGASSFLIAFNQ